MLLYAGPETLKLIIMGIYISICNKNFSAFSFVAADCSSATGIIAALPVAEL